MLNSNTMEKHYQVFRYQTGIKLFFKNGASSLEVFCLQKEE